VERIWAEAMGDTPSASHGIVCNHSRNPPSSTRDGVGTACCPVSTPRPCVAVAGTWPATWHV
jgi:hypothetical protein